MTYALKTAEAKFIMTSPQSMAIAAPAAAAAGIPKDHIFLLKGHLDGYLNLQDLIHIGKSYQKEGQVKTYKIPTGKSNANICGYLSFSSGTTGLPKAVSVLLYLLEIVDNQFALHDC